MQPLYVSQLSLAIAVYCSALATTPEFRPLTVTEWSKITELLKQLKLTPVDLLKKTEAELISLGISTEYAHRLWGLATRSITVGLTLSDLHNKGINLITRADETYPHQIKSKLKQSCPPLFYAIGNVALLNAPQLVVGFVGSRDINEADMQFTRQMVNKFVDQGYIIVSGGARGVDSVSVEQVLNLGGKAIIFTGDSLLKQLRNTAYVKAMCQQRLVILSSQSPSAGFSTGYAMQRNRYIYTQSHATLVVKSAYSEGGTWQGATQSLKKNYAPVLCWQQPCQGNQALIQAGAIPVTEQWDGSIESVYKQWQAQNCAQITPPDNVNQSQTNFLSQIEATDVSLQSSLSSQLKISCSKSNDVSIGISCSNEENKTISEHSSMESQSSTSSPISPISTLSAANIQNKLAAEKEEAAMILTPENKTDVAKSTKKRRAKTTASSKSKKSTTNLSTKSPKTTSKRRSNTKKSQNNGNDLVLLTQIDSTHAN